MANFMIVAVALSYNFTLLAHDTADRQYAPGLRDGDALAPRNTPLGTASLPTPVHLTYTSVGICVNPSCDR
jgi:hypothetical protein